MFSVALEKYGTPSFSFQKFQCRWLADGSCAGTGTTDEGLEDSLVSCSDTVEPIK
jgi:hypothetical protein